MNQSRDGPGTRQPFLRGGQEKNLPWVWDGAGQSKKSAVCGGKPLFFEGRPSLNQTINFVEGLDLRLGWDGMPPLSLVQATVTIGLVR